MFSTRIMVTLILSLTLAPVSLARRQHYLIETEDEEGNELSKINSTFPDGPSKSNNNRAQSARINQYGDGDKYSNIVQGTGGGGCPCTFKGKPCIMYNVRFCDQGWTFSHHTFGCYKFFSGTKSWSAARRSCEGHGGDLASISDQATNDFIKRLGSTPQQAWIGTKRPWRTWTDGTPWCYENWNAGEPNNAGGDEDYAAIVVGVRKKDGSNCGNCGTWNDERHDGKGRVGYVCQK